MQSERYNNKDIKLKNTKATFLAYWINYQRELEWGLGLYGASVKAYDGKVTTLSS